MTDERIADSGETIELKPCPFCGDKAVLHTDNNYDYLRFAIFCSDTKSKCPLDKTCWFTNKQAAVIAWNTRANEIDRSEYDRLKRLDAKVKKLIDSMKHCGHYKGKDLVLTEKPDLPLGLFNVPFEYIIELLESLDK